jgi:hypothetical protein
VLGAALAVRLIHFHLPSGLRQSRGILRTEEFMPVNAITITDWSNFVWQPTRVFNLVRNELRWDVRHWEVFMICYSWWCELRWSSGLLCRIVFCLCINCLYLRLWTSALKMEAVYSSETLVYSRQTARRNNPEDYHLFYKLLWFNMVITFMVQFQVSFLLQKNTVFTFNIQTGKSPMTYI